MQNNKVLTNINQAHIWAIMKMEFVLVEVTLSLMMAPFMREIGKMTTCQDMDG